MGCNMLCMTSESVLRAIFRQASASLCLVPDVQETQQAADGGADQ